MIDVPKRKAMKRNKSIDLNQKLVVEQFDPSIQGDFFDIDRFAENDDIIDWQGKVFQAWDKAKSNKEKNYILFKYLAHRTGISQRVKTRDYLMFPKSKTLKDYECPRLKFD